MRRVTDEISMSRDQKPNLRLSKSEWRVVLAALRQYQHVPAYAELTTRIAKIVEAKASEPVAD